MKFRVFGLIIILLIGLLSTSTMSAEQHKKQTTKQGTKARDAQKAEEIAWLRELKHQPFAMTLNPSVVTEQMAQAVSSRATRVNAIADALNAAINAAINYEN